MGEFRRGRLHYVVDNIELTGDADPEVRLWLALPVNSMLSTT